MAVTVAPEQINRIVWNQHHNPFEVLGPHMIQQDGKTIWAVRAYLPNAEAAWVILPEDRQEYAMESGHEPHFFECLIETEELANYQIKYKEGDHHQVIYDPYAFKTRRITDFDIHLFAEGNHHRIYEKLGAHLTTMEGVSGVYFAIWAVIAVYFYRGSVAQDETGEKAVTDRLQWWSGPSVVLFSLTTTLAAFDWIMSLAPMWFSTMFGVYLFAGSFLSAHCAITVGAYLLQRGGAMRDEVTVEHYHDLGKLIFGFIFFWTYIGFSQFMLIWYANIPEETEWFYFRQEEIWVWVSLSLVFFHWMLPFAGTMSVHVRRRPGLMFFWAAYLLIMHYVDMYWMIMPQAREIAADAAPATMGGAAGIAASLLCVVGMSMLLIGLMLRVAGSTKVIPVRDPRIRESIAFENM